MSYSCLRSLLLFVAFVGCVEACISCTVWLVSFEYEMLLCAVLMGIRLHFPSDLSFSYARVEYACWEAQLQGWDRMSRTCADCGAQNGHGKEYKELLFT